MARAGRGQLRPCPASTCPGCPAPFVNNVTQARVGGPAAPRHAACARRRSRTRSTTSRCPGSRRPTSSPTSSSPTSTYERLQVFFLGGQTPWNAVKAAKPTFLSIEIGSVGRDRRRVIASQSGRPRLHHALPGVRGELHPLRGQRGDAETPRSWRSPFPDVTQIPYTSRGTTYWCLKTGALSRCPGASSRPTSRSATTARRTRRFPARRAIRSWCRGPSAWPALLRASSPPFTPFTLDCSNTDSGGDAGGVCLRAHHHRPDEPAHPRPGGRSRAGPWSRPATCSPRSCPAAPPFPDLSTVADRWIDQFRPYFSLDGFHPSSATHRVIADAMIAMINGSMARRSPALP